MFIIKFFFTFVMMGFFSFGGGYALLPILQKQLVEELGWISGDDFLLAVAAGQITPGPVAVAATFSGFMAGYNLNHTIWSGLLYGTVAWVGSNVASVVCMGVIAKFYCHVENRPEIPAILDFLMPAVIGLIIYLAIKMIPGQITSIAQIAIAACTFALAMSKKIDYAVIIIGGAVIGLLFL